MGDHRGAINPASPPELEHCELHRALRDGPHLLQLQVDGIRFSERLNGVKLKVRLAESAVLAEDVVLR